MIYDFNFFRQHCKRIRYYRDNEAPSVIGDALLTFYGKELEAKEHYEILSAPSPLDFKTPSLVCCKGAYYKGSESIDSLESCLNIKLPEDFSQFFKEFGESVVFTRNCPVWIQSSAKMIQSFKDGLDVEVAEARFFPFAYLEDSFRLGLRRSDAGGQWQVVPYWGLLYSEITMEVGESRNPTFYQWLKHIIETDGENELFPGRPQLTVTDQGDQ